MTKQHSSCSCELREYLRKPVESIKEPLKWWIASHHTYPNLYRMALDYLSVPGMVMSYIRFDNYITNLLFVATSTVVECVFSQGRQLLSFTCNRQHASSVHAFLCMGSWGRNELLLFEDILTGVRVNLKRKIGRAHV